MAEKTDKTDPKETPFRWTNGNNQYIGPYKLTKTLGAGSFAEVRVGIHIDTGDKVAVKVIEKASMDSQKPDTRERRYKYLRREIRYMKLLNHPNIVKLFEVIETKDVIVLIMEHISGGELKGEISKTNNTGLSENRCRAYFRQMVSALSYLHSNNIVHRDLKPQNIMVDHSGAQPVIKIIDFGFTNVFDTTSALTSFIGSPSYAAPEILQGINYVGNKVDVWSLGVVLFHMATGVHPFQAKTMDQLYDKIIAGRYSIPHELPEGLRDLIKFMLNTDAEKRPTMDQVIDHPWLKIGYSDRSVPNYVIPRPKVLTTDQIDNDAVQEMVQDFNYENDQIINALTNVDSNDLAIRSTYHLLVERSQRMKQADFVKIASSEPHGLKKMFRTVRNRIVNIVKPQDHTDHTTDEAKATAVAEDLQKKLDLGEQQAADAAAAAAAAATAAEEETEEVEGEAERRPSLFPSNVYEVEAGGRRMTMRDVEDQIQKMRYLQQTGVEGETHPPIEDNLIVEEAEEEEEEE